MVETNIVATSAFVTVSGISFGTQDMTASSRVGTTSCQTVTWVSDTSATCHMSLGVGTGLAVQTTMSSVAGTQTAVFTYDGLLFCLVLLVATFFRHVQSQMAIAKVSAGRSID